MTTSLGRAVVVAAVAAAVPQASAAGGAGAPAGAGAPGVPRGSRPVASTAHPASRLRFGVYPWGTVGASGDVAGARPEDPDRTLAAVRELRGRTPFVVHLYGEYTGTDVHAAGRLLDDVRWWSAHGLRVEAVLRYRPARPDLGATFSPWVRWVARHLAAVPGVTAIQVGNEPNSRAAGEAADGAYPGAVPAIARAVPVARRAVVAAGRRDVGIGVNWAAGPRPCARTRFWPALRRAGGRPFARAISWVGIDVYPGTWTGPSRSVAPTSSRVEHAVTRTIRCARVRHLRAAGLGRRVRLTIAETGYPTDPSRSEATQRLVLEATVAAARRARSTYGVTDLRWFSLRDANTASGQLENGYGLLRDDLSAKPAFWAYRDLVRSAGR